MSFLVLQELETAILVETLDSELILSYPLKTHIPAYHSTPLHLLTPLVTAKQNPPRLYTKLRAAGGSDVTNPAT